MQTNEELTKSNYTITLDDDPLVFRNISKFLNIKSLPYTSPDNLIKNAHKFKPLCAFIDINLEDGKCGLDVVSILKDTWPYTPIIIITNNPTASAVGDALASGADDFIKKPLRKEELIARFQARRKQLLQLSLKETIAFKDLNLNSLQRKLNGPKGNKYLSPTELSLLKSFIEASGTVVPRESLKRQCWGELAVSDSALDRHISGLRSAINGASEVLQLKSVYGKGYLLAQN